ADGCQHVPTYQLRARVRPSRTAGTATVGSGAVGPLPAAAVMSQTATMSARYGAAPVTGLLAWLVTLAWSRPLTMAELLRERTRSMPPSARCTAACRPVCWPVNARDDTKNVV